MFCLYLESNSVHYVIIGAGPAAVAAAEKLRVLDAGGQVTMIGAQAQQPYSRMAIPLDWCVAAGQALYLANG